MNKILARSAVATALGGLTLGLPVALATPAVADVDKKGSCSQGGARYEIEVEKDDGRFEIDFEVDSNVQGQRWRVALLHDGKRVFKDVRRTDDDGEVGFDRERRNTAGRDVFKARAKNLGTGEVCRVKVVRR